MFTENHTLAQKTLNRLKAGYARDGSVVGHPDNLTALPVLRALEHAGLIEIKVVVMNKSWVVTAAGAIWLTLLEAGPDKRLSMDRNILCSLRGCWMTIGEALAGARHLAVADLCDITNESGQTPQYHTLVPIYLTLKYGDPLRALAQYQPEKETA